MFTVLGVRRSGDVGELKKFFNGGEYGLYQVLRIVDCLLDDVFALEELVGNQLTVVLLKVSQHVRDSVVDIIGRAVADIREVRFLHHGKKNCTRSCSTNVTSRNRRFFLV